MAEPSAPPSYDQAVTNKDPYGPQQPYNPSYQSTGYPPQNASYPPQQPYAQEGFQSSQFAGGYAPVATATNVTPQYQNAPPAVVDSGHEGFTTGATFDSMSVRRLFIRKVFLVLGLQLLITFGFVCIFYFVDPLKFYVQRNSWIYYVAYAVFFVLYFVLVCFTSAARKHPWNLVMLLLLTLALSYMVGTITSFYNIEAVLIGLGVTVAVCVTVMIFSIQTKFDFTKCGGLLFVLLMVLILFGFVTIFTWHRSWYLQVVYGCLGALVFTLFLAYDTQLVMGGRRYELDPEEYVFGALMLYIDIVYIFLFILSIVGGSSN